MFKRLSSYVLGLTSLTLFSLPIHWWGVLKGGNSNRPKVYRTELTESQLHDIREDIVSDACIEDFANNRSAVGCTTEPPLDKFRSSLFSNLKHLLDHKDGGFSASAFIDGNGKVYAGIAGANVTGVSFLETLKDTPEMWRLTACNTTANVKPLKMFLAEIQKATGKMPDVIVSHSIGTLPVLAVMAYGENYLPPITQICLFDDPGVTAAMSALGSYKLASAGKGGFYFI